MASREEEFLSDLECGKTSSEKERNSDPVSVCSRGKKSLSRGHSETSTYNGSISGNSDMDSSDSFSKSRVVTGQRVELLIERSSGDDECGDLVTLLDKRNVSAQCKTSGLKKASKPPRPPKGPLLNATDLKLVKELSEIAARKRARIERMRALRKMNETKQISCSSTLTAMVITILFFLVIIFQGVFTRNAVRKSQDSPAPTIAREALISVQLFNNAPTSEMNKAASASLNSWEWDFSSSHPVEKGRDTG